MKSSKYHLHCINLSCNNIAVVRNLAMYIYIYYALENENIVSVYVFISNLNMTWYIVNANFCLTLIAIELVCHLYYVLFECIFCICVLAGVHISQIKVKV
jgi:hypothetical protein